MDSIQSQQLHNEKQLGRLIAGRYKLLDSIGTGGMGTVFKAEHVLLHKPMALKVLRVDRTSVTDINRFQREAKAASALNHPNLVSVHDYGAADGELFIAMDFVDGKSLSAEISERGTIPQEEALALFIQVCEGMSAAHKKGILHRDLKPSNIMIDRTGKTPLARVLDFGIATMADIDPDSSLSKLTQTGEVVGSPSYMSPEQCTGATLDQRSDIYAFGCVMFEALTGKPAFAAETPVMTMFKQLNERAPLIRSVNKDIQVKPELERVILQTLEKEPQNRYQSMNDLAADLLLIQQGKNPVKEVSQMRNGIKRAATATKLVLTALAIPLVAFATWQAQPVIMVLTMPKWQVALANAEAQEVLGNSSNARAHFRDALRLAEEEHAPPSALASINYGFGKFYNLNDQFESATKFLLKSLTYADKNRVYPERAFTEDFLLDSYSRLSNYKLAREHGEKALALKRQLFPSSGTDPNRQLIGNTLIKLQEVYRRTGDLQKAESVGREYLQIELALHPKADHGDVSFAYRDLACTLLTEHKMDEGLADAQKAVDLGESVFEPDNSARKGLEKWLVRTYNWAGKSDQAEATAKRFGLNVTEVLAEEKRQ